MISTAVFSHRLARGCTTVDRAGLALWVLSVQHARRHFRRLVLVTDAPGRELLAERLELPFDEVRVELEDFEPEFRHIWSLGKIHAYGAMDEPFVHLDHDVILWQPLPERLLRARVFSLIVEPMPPGHPRLDWYRPGDLADVLPVAPAAVRAHARAAADQHAFNLGIFGGTDVAFIRAYAASALAALREPANRAFWRECDGTIGSVQLEQYWLAALAREHGLAVETLVTPEEDADPDERRYRELGFTHVWGGSKRREPYRERILQRCRRDFPKGFRCVEAIRAS